VPPIFLIHSDIIGIKRFATNMLFLITSLEKPMLCGADERISASCENCSSANISSLTLKETNLAPIFCQMQNVLFFILRREMFVQNV
jgi:hypothetical protein